MLDSRRFSAFDLKGDIFGGVTTAIISLPLALAFGVASGAGAEAGLWGAIMVGFFCSVVWWLHYANLRTDWPDDGDYDGGTDQHDGRVPSERSGDGFYRGDDGGCVSNAVGLAAAW